MVKKHGCGREWESFFRDWNGMGFSPSYFMGLGRDKIFFCWSGTRAVWKSTPVSPSIPNLYECLCSAENKGRYSEECGKQSSSGALLISVVFFFLLQWKSMVPQNSLVTNFLQNIFLCVQQNKEIHTGLELHVTTSKWWHNFHFWVNYPFKTGFVVQGYIFVFFSFFLLWTFKHPIYANYVYFYQRNIMPWSV